MKVVAGPLKLMVSVSVLLDRSPVSDLSVVVSSAVNAPGRKSNMVVVPDVVAGLEFGEFRGAISWPDGL
jgi:hypothetical protein